MSNRIKLSRLVRTLSEAEVYTVLRFVQFLDAGHVRAHVKAPRQLVKQFEVATVDPVEIPDFAARPRVELIQGLPSHVDVTADDRSVHRGEAPRILDGAVRIPRGQWPVTLDGFSDLFFDLNCHLWVQLANGDTHTLARDMPLGQIYFDEKGSELNAVQVALNRSGTVYSDFRFMHRIGEPEAIYIREAAKGELADLIVVSDGRYTVLEVSMSEPKSPGFRRLAFLDLIKERQASSVP